MSEDAPFLRSWVIAKAKVVDYLLNLDHSRGASKARFFIAFGFSPERPDELADALAGHRMANETAPTDRATRGRLKIVFEGPIASPDGRNPLVRTVWTVDAEGIARFVTAVPVKP